MLKQGRRDGSRRPAAEEPAQRRGGRQSRTGDRQSGTRGRQSGTGGHSTRLRREHVVVDARRADKRTALSLASLTAAATTTVRKCWTGLPLATESRRAGFLPSPTAYRGFPATEPVLAAAPTATAHHLRPGRQRLPGCLWWETSAQDAGHRPLSESHRRAISQRSNRLAFHQVRRMRAFEASSSPSAMPARSRS